jgi:hypothetical protein
MAEQIAGGCLCGGAVLYTKPPGYVLTARHECDGKLTDEPYQLWVNKMWGTQPLPLVMQDKDCPVSHPAIPDAHCPIFKALP